MFTDLGSLIGTIDFGYCTVWKSEWLFRSSRQKFWIFWFVYIFVLNDFTLGDCSLLSLQSTKLNSQEGLPEMTRNYILSKIFLIQPKFYKQNFSKNPVLEDPLGIWATKQTIWFDNLDMLNYLNEHLFSQFYMSFLKNLIFVKMKICPEQNSICHFGVVSEIITNFSGIKELSLLSSTKQ